jgi:hypothetical protein
MYSEWYAEKIKYDTSILNYTYIILSRTKIIFKNIKIKSFRFLSWPLTSI